MKGDIGMANYKQEAAYPIRISLYNCYRTVRHAKRGIATTSLAFLIVYNSCIKILGWGIQPLVPLNLPSLYYTFYTCSIAPAEEMASIIERIRKVEEVHKCAKILPRQLIIRFVYYLE